MEGGRNDRGNEIKETDSFSPGVNDALNAKLRALRDAKKEVLRLEGNSKTRRSSLNPSRAATMGK